MVTSPSSGRSTVESIRIVVVFPAPLGPSRPKISCAADGERDVVDGLDGAKGLSEMACYDEVFGCGQLGLTIYVSWVCTFH